MRHKLKSFYRYHIKGSWEFQRAKQKLKTDEVPVVVYTMAKVGSMSVYKSLLNAGLNSVFHVHSFQSKKIKEAYIQCRKKGWWPDSKNTGALIYQHKIKQGNPVKLITIVREPIERNISAFFEVFRFYNDVNAANYHGDMSGLANNFKTKLPHEYPLVWFDEELNKTTGIDVYSCEFEKKKRWQVYKNKHIDLLLFRIDLPDQEKEDLIKSFLQLEHFHLMNYNVGAEKEYASLYLDFKNQLNLPQSYIKQMLNSKYCIHFYTNDEITNFLNAGLNLKFGECKNI